MTLHGRAGSISSASKLTYAERGGKLCSSFVDATQGMAAGTEGPVWGLLPDVVSCPISQNPFSPAVWTHGLVNQLAPPPGPTLLTGTGGMGSQGGQGGNATLFTNILFLFKQTERHTPWWSILHWMMSFRCSSRVSSMV